MNYLGLIFNTKLISIIDTNNAYFHNMHDAHIAKKFIIIMRYLNNNKECKLMDNSELP